MREGLFNLGDFFLFVGGGGGGGGGESCFGGFLASIWGRRVLLLGHFEC